MPFAKRDSSGSIVALTAAAEPGSDEPIAADHPDVIAFLGDGDAAASRLAALDTTMARVTEDLIDVLVTRGVLMFTDLPASAQRKLLERQRLRERRDAAPGTFLAPEGDDLI
ncbi:MAG: tryptophan synthase subunit beta like protein [Alphaproteobacteria bacterium]|nr:tryptophan synthase subunit beta like protein [Alphaproteobacteria bacterium]